MRHVGEALDCGRNASLLQLAVADLSRVSLAPATHRGVFHKSAGVSVSAGDGLGGVDILDGDGSFMLLGLAVTELSVVASAPAGDLSGFVERTAMFAAGADLLDIEEIMDIDRIGSVLIILIAKLAVAIISPAASGAIMANGAGVAAADEPGLASGDGDAADIGQIHNSYRGVAFFKDCEVPPVTELTFLVSAPAVDVIALDDSAAKEGAGRDGERIRQIYGHGDGSVQLRGVYSQLSRPAGAPATDLSVFPSGAAVVDSGGDFYGRGDLHLHRTCGAIGGPVAQLSAIIIAPAPNYTVVKDGTTMIFTGADAGQSGCIFAVDTILIRTDISGVGDTAEDKTKKQ